MQDCGNSLSERLALMQALSLSHLQEDDIPLLKAAALNRTMSIRGDFPAAKDALLLDIEGKTQTVSISSKKPQSSSRAQSQFG
jgi:hypothetical protein